MKEPKTSLPPIDLRKRLAAFAKAKRPCCHHCAGRVGFGSVFTKILCRLLECLAKEVEFRYVPETLTYGFGYEKGWRDFFVPFCEEKRFNFVDKIFVFLTVKGPLWLLLSWRACIDFCFSWRQVPYGTVFKNHSAWVKLKPSLSLFDRGILLLRYRVFKGDYRFLRKILWLSRSIDHGLGISLGKTYAISGYERPLNFLEGGRLVFRELWQFRPEVAQAIQERRKRIGLLAGEYIAIHIRRGDKINDTSYTPVSLYVKYIEAFEKTSPLPRKVFVMSDDYAVLDELQAAMPGWEIHTLCPPESEGNETDEWAAASPASKRDSRLLYLTELMIAKDAQYFFGTLTSNVFILCTFLRDTSPCFYVDDCLRRLRPGYDEGFKKAFDAAHPEAVALRRRVRG